MLDLRHSNIREIVADIIDFGALLVGLFIYLGIVFLPWALLILAAMLVQVGTRAVL